MSYANRLADPAGAGTVSVLGTDIHDGVEVVERRSSLLWDEYKILRKDQPACVRILNYSCNNEEVLDYYTKSRQELKKFEGLAEEPFAYLVPFINLGVTREHSFPYIETRYPENKIDLPADRICTTEQIFILTEQLSRTLAICHNAGIVHGAITFDTIWYDPFHQYYILDGFGASLLNNQQREKLFSNYPFYDFLFPEQKVGQISFQTDVHNTAVVLLQMLTGNKWKEVFEVTNKGDFQKMISSIRKNNHPGNNYTIPEWFTAMVYSCLQKGAEVFSNGLEVYDHFLFHQLRIVSHPQDNVRRQNIVKRKSATGTRLGKLRGLKFPRLNKQMQGKLSRKSQWVLIALAIATTAFMISAGITVSSTNDTSNARISTKQNTQHTKAEMPAAIPGIIQKSAMMIQPEQPSITAPSITKNQKTSFIQTKNTPIKKKSKVYREGYTLDLHTGLGTYQVISKAFFYTNPDESTKRPAHIVHWNNALLTPIKEEKDFFYIVFTNHFGQTSKGWLRKKDVVRVADQ